jgi:hypothetical protein
MTSSEKRDAWFIDQLAKSQLFHEKLHEWQMLEIAEQIEQIQGELLNWNLELLGISDHAWNKIIHRGIKPVIVFAHPEILMNINFAISYYRMLAIVSQKSMNQIGLSTINYEQGHLPDLSIANLMAKHLNKIISHLVEADEKVSLREFDLWRGMAAGTQAQGSWQNVKGKKVEYLIQGILENHLYKQKLLDEHLSDKNRLYLKDQRVIVFSDEPDIAIYENNSIQIAVEIKGGIDSAGVLERVGASIKSLSRVKQQNKTSVTILLLQAVSLSEQAKNDLQINQDIVNHWFTVEQILDKAEKQIDFFKLLKLT